MSDESASAGGKQRSPHLFQPGQSGNPRGRTKGSRNKLGEDFIAALQEDFQKHGEGVIAEVRESKPDAYLKVIASLLPREIKIESANDLTDDELDKRIRQLAAALSLEIGAGGAPSGEEAPDGSQPTSGLPTVQ